MKRVVLAGLAAVGALLLSACGGGGGGSVSSVAPASGIGYYIDAPVKGVGYQCGAFGGKTDARGAFRFEKGKGCRFTLGGLVLREMNSSDLHNNIYVLEDNPKVAAILQTLDRDGNASDAIEIVPEAGLCLDSFNGLADVNLSELYQCLDQNVSDYNGSEVNETEAMQHVAQTAADNTPTPTTPTPLTISEDNATDITLTGSDPQGDALQFRVVDDPDHGTVTGTAPNLHYVPNPNFNGTDTIIYVVSDGTFEANGTITITVNAVNDAPAAVADTATVAEDGTVNIDVLANDTDEENNTLSIDAVTQPGDGNATISGGVITYTSSVNFNGTDSFTYTVSDGNGGTATATVTVTVTPVNDAPVANDVNVTTAEDSTISIDLLTYPTTEDVDNDTLTIYSITNPTNGTANVSGGTVTYTPNANYSGTDSFTYTVSDGNSTATATVYITITPVNDAPVLQAISDLNLTEDFNTTTVNLNASDVDDANLTYSVTLSNGAPITATVNGTTLTLASIADASGSATVTVTVSDGSATDSKDFTVTVDPVNDAPVLQAISDLNLTEDFNTTTVNLNASDVDGDTLTYSVTLSNGAPITATVNGTTLTLASITDASGSATVTVTVSDGSATDSQDFTVTVDPVNDAPVFQAISDLTLDEDFNTTTVELNASDVDSATLDYNVSVSDTSLLTASLSGTTLTLHSVANASGSATVTVTVSDGSATDSKDFTVTVDPVNDAPVLQAISDLTLNEDFNTTTVELNASDVDGDSLTYSVSLSTGAPITATVNGSTLTLEPVANANGSVTVTVTVGDGSATDSKTFKVTVDPVNDAPTAENFTRNIMTSSTGNVIDLASHVSDPDGDDLNITVFDPLTGLSKIDTLKLKYDNNGTEGTFTVGYTVSDPDGLSAAGHITIIVSQAPVIPVANDDTVTITEDDNATALHVLNNDINGSVISVAWVEGNGTGTATISNNDVLYTPAPNFSGTAYVHYTLQSSTSHEDNATVTITVTPVNDTPVLQAISDLTLNEDFNTTTVEINASDVDGDTLDYNVSVDNPLLLMATVSGTTLTLHSVANTNGSTNITVTVSDGNVSDSETFSATVNPVADQPVVVSGQSITIELNATAPVVFTPAIEPSDENFALSNAASDNQGIVTVSVNSSSLALYPHGTGTADINYTVANDQNSSLSTVVHLYVTVYDPRNTHPPVVSNMNIEVEVDQILSEHLNASDDDNDPLVYAIATSPAHGTVSIDESSGNFVYEPDDGYIGDDSFVVTVSDGRYETNATVTITVHESDHQYDDDDDTETPITEAEFNTTNALQVPCDQKFYGYDFDHENDEVLVEIEWHYFDCNNHIVVIHEPDHDENLSYSEDDNHMVTLDFDNDGTADFAWKYMGELNANERDAWLAERNLTLPGTAVIYRARTIELTEEYDLYDNVMCTGHDENGNCEGNYTDLSDLADATTFESNVSDVWDLRELWIDGYGFMLAEGSDFGNNASGTLVRVSRYYDHAQNKHVAVVTRDNAGTWEKREVDGTTYLVVTPTVYGIDEVKIYGIGNDNVVHKGEYRPANRAVDEYNFDEATAYMLANAQMPRRVHTERELESLEGAFVSFDSLPTVQFVPGIPFYQVNTYMDGNNQFVEENDTIYFDQNGTVLFGEGDSASYTLNGNIATLNVGNGNAYDAKCVAKITDPNEIASELNISVNALGSNPTLYKITFVANNDILWINDVFEVYDNGQATTYNTIDEFIIDFKNRSFGVGYVQESNGERIFCHNSSDSSDNAGELGVYSEQNGQLQFVRSAGSWERTTIDGKDAILFHVDQDIDADEMDAVVQDGNKVHRADFEEKDTGSLENRVSEATAQAILTYLRNNNESYHLGDNDIDIERNISGVAVANYVDTNLTTAYKEECNESVTIHSVYFDSANSKAIISSAPSPMPYRSADGVVIELLDGSQNATAHMKTAAMLDAAAIESLSGLVVPQSVQAYKIVWHMLDDDEKVMELRFGEDDLIYLQSYLMNNPYACDGDDDDQNE